jgi:hypothetical protein
MTHSQEIQSISDCPICRNLSDSETSFSKYGWPESDISMHGESAHLVNIDKDRPDYNDRHHLLQCPVCGTFYFYDYTYEYLVNGSEDEETINRLTPTQVQHRLTQEVYEQHIRFMHSEIAKTDVQTKTYAAKCLTDHYISIGDYETLNPLLQYDDVSVVRGVLLCIYRLLNEKASAELLAYLSKQILVLNKIILMGDDNIKALVRVITEELKK